MIAADIYRPVCSSKTLGLTVDVPVFALSTEVPLQLVFIGLEQAKANHITTMS